MTGLLMFHLFAAFTEFERNHIQELSAMGRIEAKKKDVLVDIRSKGY